MVIYKTIAINTKLSSNKNKRTLNLDVVDLNILKNILKVKQKIVLKNYLKIFLEFGKYFLLLNI